MFTTFNPEPSQVSGFGEDMGLEAMGRGTVNLETNIDRRSISTTLHDMLYVPKAINCLLVVGRIDTKGGIINFLNGKVTIRQPDRRVRIKGKLVHCVYPLDAHTQSKDDIAKVATDSPGISWLELHCCYGHASIHGLRQMITGKVVEGLKVDPSSNLNFQCKACIAAKMSITPFPKYGATRAIKVGDITHSDLWGPARVESIGRNLYYIAFIDDYSHYVTIKFLNSKSEVTQKVKDYTEWIKMQSRHTVKAFRFNGGGEFMSKNLKGWLDEFGIEQQTSTPYSPQQHGIAEHPNCTLVELMRAMLIDTKLPKFLWAEAVLHTAYI